MENNVKFKNEQVCRVKHGGMSWQERAMKTFVESPHRQEDSEWQYPFGKSYPERSNPQWLPYFEAIDQAYNKKRRILPKNTILYHGSLSPLKKKDYITFFGLDFRISAWILAEQWAKTRLRTDGPVPPY